MIRIASGAIGCALLTTLVGCGQDAEDDEAGQNDGAAATSDAATPDGGDAWVAAVAAMRTAEEETDEGIVVALDRGEECDGQPCWEIDVVEGTDRQFEVWVSQDGQNVIESEAEDDVDDDASLAVEARRSAVEVAEKAIDDYGGAVAGLEIDTLGDGTAVWEMTLDDNGSQTEYKFDTESAEPISSAPAED